MTKDEALKLALEALNSGVKTKSHRIEWIEYDSLLVEQAITAIKEALAQTEQEPVAFINVEQRKLEWAKYMSWDTPTVVNLPKIPLYTTPPQPMHPEIKKMYEDYFDKCFRESSPTQQEPVAWKLVPIKPTDEMLKAMDECSTEGYDERLLAGHASSVYMAAVDVAPTPPQRTWVGLTDEELDALYRAVKIRLMGTYDTKDIYRAVEAKLKEKNT